MKKIVILLLVMIISASAAFAELTLSGEVKTGLTWDKKEPDPKTGETSTKARIHSYDDAGDYEGRFRLNLDYINEEGTLGFKARIQWQQWQKNDDDMSIPEAWPYAFGYGNFFDNQLTMSIGKLGGSPWGTGGPEKWKELEMNRSGGVRFEWKPKFIEEYGRLNLGFVLNGPEAYTDAGGLAEPTMIDFLKESIIGLSFTHDYFMIRFAYRLDSEMDKKNRGLEGKEGDDFLYRVEERALQKVLPGFQVWALGYIQGVGGDGPQFVEHYNWLFVQYAPHNFTAQIRFGYEGAADRSLIFAKPNFYYKFFDGLIEVGALFGIAQDYGTKIYPDSPYSYYEIIPKLQVNFAQGAYAAFEYYYKQEYAFRTYPPLSQTQWVNLRFGIYF